MGDALADVLKPETVKRLERLACSDWVNAAVADAANRESWSANSSV